MPDVYGLIVVDKPAGPSSHDVVDRVRQVTRLRRIGHTGTLDPMAEGVLVLCLGKATRLSQFLTADRKRYRGTLRLGVTTSTYDAEGEVTDRAAVDVDVGRIEAALGSFRGRIEQRPPPFSARRTSGQRAYELARSGQAVELEPREVEIRALELIAFDGTDAVLDVECSAGTYVRALAHDLGAKLGCGAHLTALTRTACGEFTRDDAIALARLEEERARWREHLRPPEAGLGAWPSVTLDASEAEGVVNGKPIRLRHDAAVELGGRWRAHGPDGRLLAVVEPVPSRGVFRLIKVFP